MKSGIAHQTCIVILLIKEVILILSFKSFIWIKKKRHIDQQLLFNQLVFVFWGIKQ